MKVRTVGEYFQNPVSGVGGDPSGIGQAQSFRDGSLGEAFRDGSLGEAFRDGSLGVSVRPHQISQRSVMTKSRALRSSLFGLAGGGLGELSSGEMYGLFALGVLVRGAGGYFAGRAMGDKYKWWGAGSAVLLGAAGLGILGVVAKKK